MKLTEFISYLQDYASEHPDASVTDPLLDYDDGYYDVDSAEDFLHVTDEVTPFYCSDRAKARLLGGESFASVFSNASIYFYGYKPASVMETVLSRNLSVNLSQQVQAVSTETGDLTRFEVVDNSDLFCYCTGGIGISTAHPMCMSSTTASKGVVIYVDAFAIKLAGDEV